MESSNGKIRIAEPYFNSKAQILLKHRLVRNVK